MQGPTYQSSASYTYDGGNRLTQAVDSIAGTIGRNYDGLDRLTSETTPQGTVSYTYDAASRRATMSVPGQAQTTYTWDNGNRPTGIAQGSSSVGFSYDNANRRTQLTLPNGVTVAYTYDSDSHVSGITYSANAMQLGNLTYTYDADGRRTQAGGSLAAVNLPNPLSSVSFNADNEMTAFGAAALTYDANGNLTSDGSNSYAWDARNHLSQISGSVSASYIYDALGRRTTKTVGANVTQFVYDALNPVQELTGAGSVSANLLTGLGIDQYFSRSDSSGAMALLADALGSTLGLVNSAGSIATSYTYEPFGNVTVGGAPNTNPYQFTGRENDGTGLYFYRARYYSPSRQSFLSQDPLNFAGGATNLYSYADNDPVLITDPVGLWTFGFGGTVTYTYNGTVVTWSLLLVIDGNGNVGVALTGGLGAGEGEGLSGGGTFQLSNAQTIQDLQGPFGEFSVGIEGVSGGYFGGNSPNGYVQGLDVTVGEGVGGGGGYSVTSTVILPFPRRPHLCQ